MKLNVLLLYRSSIIPSLELCGHAQLKYLSQKGLVNYHSASIYKVTPRQLANADIIIFGRLDNAYELSVFSMIRECHNTVLYILDDDLPDIPSELSSGSYYHTPEIQRSLRSLIDLCDGIISPSPLLLEKYGKNKKYNILVEEPALHFADFQNKSDFPVKIGFAGSIDRIGDLENILKKVLTRLKMEYADKIEFHFMGAIPSFANNLQSICTPYQNNYETYLKHFGELGWDIGLAPMPDSAFHRFKHYIKFIEYSAMGIIGIYSKVQPYLRLLPLEEKKVLCFAKDEEDWYRLLKRLIDQPALRNQMRENAFRYAQEHYSIDTISSAFYEDLRKIPSAPKTSQFVFYIRVRGTQLRSLIKLFCTKCLRKLLKIKHKIFG